MKLNASTCKQCGHKDQPVYLRARCGVRYWEDATVNGEADDDGSRIPCRDGTAEDNDEHGGGDWTPTIVLATGQIERWSLGTTASVHYKICDDGEYELLDSDRRVIARKEGYVPKIMSPGGRGYGDYVIMNVGPDGRIAGWTPEFVTRGLMDLSEDTEVIESGDR